MITGGFWERSPRQVPPAGRRSLNQVQGDKVAGAEFSWVSRDLGSRLQPRLKLG